MATAKAITIRTIPLPSATSFVSWTATAEDLDEFEFIVEPFKNQNCGRLRIGDYLAMNIFAFNARMVNRRHNCVRVHLLYNDATQKTKIAWLYSRDAGGRQKVPFS